MTGASSMHSAPESLAHIEPDQWTHPYWQGLLEHKLLVQECDACGTPRTPPSSFCWKCRAHGGRWRQVPGTGTLFSYTVIWYSTAPEVTDDDLPYSLGVIALDGAEGCRLVANLVEVEPDEIQVGASLEVVYRDIRSDLTLLAFRPALQASVHRVLPSDDGA